MIEMKTEYVTIEDSRKTDEKGIIDIAKMRQEGEIDHKALLALALRSLNGLIVSLMPLTRGEEINKTVVMRELSQAYPALGVIFRGDLLNGACACHREGCECHKTLYNLLDLHELDENPANIEVFTEVFGEGYDIGPSRVELTDPEKEENARDYFFNEGAGSTIAQLLSALFGEPEADEREVEPVEA